MLPYIHLPIWPHQIPTFGIMLWAAAVVAAIMVDRAFRREGIDADAVGMVAVAVVAGIVGAKLWHVVDTPSDFRELGWGVLWDTAGFAWYGGVVFGIGALVIQGVKARIGGLRMLDLSAPAAAVGYGVGRIGCFLSGDGCYGIAIEPVQLLGHTFRAWGMAFPNGLEPVYVPVYPTPLYEFAAGLVIGGWLWWRAGKPYRTGSILGQYLVLSGIVRFLVEGIRRNPAVIWHMSSAQLASVGAVIAGFVLMAWAVSRPMQAERKSQAAVEKPA